MSAVLCTPLTRGSGAHRIVPRDVNVNRNGARSSCAARPGHGAVIVPISSVAAPDRRLWRPTTQLTATVEGEDRVAGPVLEARGVTKRYGGVLALDKADFSAFPGEIVALIGDNGAGKSTLIKVLAGGGRPGRGEVLIDGEPVHLSSPLDARRHGIETVYQDLALAPDLDAAANLHLGREIYLIPFLHVLNRRAMRERAISAFADLGIQLPDVRAPVGTLSGGQRQSVAVARAVIYASRVIFMDEPTAALGVVQRGRVLDTMRRVRDRGVAVVLVSHNMPEVLAVTDRVEVLRLGRRVASY